MIEASALVGKFKQAFADKWGYIWGTAGETWTALKQQKLEQTTDAEREQGRRYGKQWIGHMVADCSGLFAWAFRQLGGKMYHGSNTMYLKWCAAKGKLEKGKRTDGKPLKPGTAVFVWNGRNYSHVGLYIGNGSVIEAMGTNTGVTVTRVTLSKWTHWGELCGVDYGEEEPPEAAGPSGGAELLRKGSKGEAVRELQAALIAAGYSCGPCGADGDFGACTDAALRSFQRDRGLAADGVCGPATRAELEKTAVSPQAPAETEAYRVTVSGLDRAQAQAILDSYPGRCEMEVERA